MAHMTRARAAAENITVAAVPLKQWKERKPRIYKTAAAKRNPQQQPDPEPKPGSVEQAPKRRRKSQPRRSPAA